MWVANRRIKKAVKNIGQTIHDEMNTGSYLTGNYWQINLERVTFNNHRSVRDTWPLDCYIKLSHVGVYDPSTSAFVNKTRRIETHSSGNKGKMLERGAQIVYSPILP